MSDLNFYCCRHNQHVSSSIYPLVLHMALCWRSKNTCCCLVRLCCVCKKFLSICIEFSLVVCACCHVVMRLGLLTQCSITIKTVYTFSSCEEDRPVIHVFDSRGDNKELAVLDKVHSSNITFMEV